MAAKPESRTEIVTQKRKMTKRLRLETIDLHVYRSDLFSSLIFNYARQPSPYFPTKIFQVPDPICFSYSIGLAKGSVG